MRADPRGFTLIEVLLAMAITAMLAVMAYAGLSTAINAASRHGEQVRRLGDVQTAMTWLVRDLRESVDRPIVDASGEQQPSITGSPVDDTRLQLTRIGWDNPRGQRRGSVERVRYRLDSNGDLWRENWLVLDRFDDDTDLQSVKLLSGIENCKIQFLNGHSANARTAALGGEWVEQWPVNKGDAFMPLAVQFELDIKGFGVVRRVIGLANEQDDSQPGTP